MLEGSLCSCYEFVTCTMRPMFNNQALAEDGLLLYWDFLPWQQTWRGKLLWRVFLPSEEGLVTKVPTRVHEGNSAAAG